MILENSFQWKIFLNPWTSQQIQRDFLDILLWIFIDSGEYMAQDSRKTAVRGKGRYRCWTAQGLLKSAKLCCNMDGFRVS